MAMMSRSLSVRILPLPSSIGDIRPRLNLLVLSFRFAVGTVRSRDDSLQPLCRYLMMIRHKLLLAR